jgi:hypothetical protein
MYHTLTIYILSCSTYGFHFLSGTSADPKDAERWPLDVGKIGELALLPASAYSMPSAIRRVMMLALSPWYSIVRLVQAGD